MELFPTMRYCSPPAFLRHHPIILVQSFNHYYFCRKKERRIIYSRGNAWYGITATKDDVVVHGMSKGRLRAA